MSRELLTLLGGLAAAVVTAIIGPIAVERYKRRHRLEDPDSRLVRPPHATTAAAIAPDSSRQPALSDKGTGTVTQSRSLRQLSPDDIADHLHAVPPLRRDAVARELFVGRRVQWEGRFSGVFKIPKGFGVSLISDGTRSMTMMFFTLPEDARDRLDMLHEGDLLAFQGRIAKVDGNDIDFDEVTLF